jgi:UDP-N-acetylbacillosamine N-acetyltransferase
MTHLKDEIGLYILGFGGHSRAVADVAVSTGWSQIIFVDQNTKTDEYFYAYPTIKDIPEQPKPFWSAFPAAGDNLRRQRQVMDTKIIFTTLISPYAKIGLEAKIGNATIVSHGAYVGPAATVGNGVILNTRSIIEHEAEVGHFTHISVNAVVAGRSKIGDFVFLGAGVVVIDSVSICSNVIVGAGAVVTRSIDEPGVYVGVPARRVK